MSQGFHHNKARGLADAARALIAQNELLRKGGDDLCQNSMETESMKTISPAVSSPAETVRPPTAGSITVEVKGVHIAGADISAFNNPTARAITDRTGKPCLVWAGRVRIGDKVYGLPPECDAQEAGFTKTNRMAPYRFRLSNEVVETTKSTQPASPAPNVALSDPKKDQDSAQDVIETAWRLFDGQRIEVYRGGRMVFAGNKGEPEEKWLTQ